ncbi:MAG: GNAT family N-acetyltransferase [Phycisphaerales bacterium]
MPRVVDETTFFYELPSRAAFRSCARVPDPEPTFVRVSVPCPPLNRMLYAAVGAKWWWVDRLPWSQEQWLSVLTAEGYETQVAYLGGAPCAYVELATPTDTGKWDRACSPSVSEGLQPPPAQPRVETKIEYFGVLDGHHGRGIGGWLLGRAVERAFARGSSRVLLTTSSLDHHAARANYEARGFVLRHQETAQKTLPDVRPGVFGA